MCRSTYQHVYQSVDQHVVQCVYQRVDQFVDQCVDQHIDLAGWMMATSGGSRFNGIYRSF